MRLPKPLPGLVLHYNYLWADEAADGQDVGFKNRPAVIVMLLQEKGNNQTRAYVLPITHSEPDDVTPAMAIPADVAKAAGLDQMQSWVILDEFNEFLWPGFDLAVIPGSKPATMAYGFVTPGFFNQIRDRWLKLDEAGKSASIDRDEAE